MRAGAACFGEEVCAAPTKKPFADKCQQRAFNFFEASALKTVAMDSGRFPRSRAGHLASA